MLGGPGFREAAQGSFHADLIRHVQREGKSFTAAVQDLASGLLDQPNAR
ncbi:hypothetical protein ABT337_25340 [Saccharopolyspora hirsuta]